MGELFNEVKELESVKRACLESYRLENVYRDGNYTLEETLNDTRYAALQLCVNGTKGGVPDAKIVEPMRDGIKRLGSHLVRDRFGPNLEVKVAAAKVHLLASCLAGDTDLKVEQLSFDLAEQLEFIRSAKIADPQCLNRLRKTAPEAFYYLTLALGSEKRVSQ